MRYDVYLKRTEPIIDLLKNRGYEIMQVNGEQSIEDVFKDVIQKLNDSNKNATGDTNNA